MTAWERFIYAAALAFWRALFEVMKERGAVIEEVPNAKDADATRRFRVLVHGMQDGAPAGPDRGPPAGG